MADIPTGTRVVRRPPAAAPRVVEADIAVLGAGSAGLSAALEAARLGRRVALIDGQPSLGGQAVHSVIGIFCGLYSNGVEPYQVTGGIVDEILADLGAEGSLNAITGRRNTRIVQYDEVALARWVEGVSPPSRTSRRSSVPWCAPSRATAGGSARSTWRRGTAKCVSRRKASSTPRATRF